MMQRGRHDLRERQENAPAGRYSIVVLRAPSCACSWVEVMLRAQENEKGFVTCYTLQSKRLTTEF